MANTFGPQTIDNVGFSIQLTADGFPEFKSAGVSVDWSTVGALGSDTTYNDGIVALSGTKALRYGQVLCRITNQPTQTFAIGGTPTGGTFTVTGTRPDTGATTTVTALAYNTTVAQFQTAMDTIFGTGNTVVSGAGALPGNTLTVTFQGALIGYTVAALTADITGLTGGTPTKTITVTIAGGTYGYYGPYDPAATDGRQTLTRGSAYAMNSTYREDYLSSIHPDVLFGGRVFKSRMIMTTGTHTLAAGPTVAECETVFPRMQWLTQA